MKKYLLPFILFAISVMPLAAQDYGQDRTIKIWDNSSAPHSSGLTAPETEIQPTIIGSVTEAKLYVFEADPEKATGQSVIICPGGGYLMLSMGHEGVDMAKWLASNGITAAVLKYRIPDGHKEVPLEDAVEALRILRRKARKLKIDPDRIGIMGFSAGGHLAAYTSNFAPEGERPAFSVLFYPVITSEPGLCHKGSFDKLLGFDASETERAAYSLERCVTDATPPALLLLTDDDTVVPPVNSTLYYNALKEHGIAASIHIYPEGGHGWGIKADAPYRDDWQPVLLDWLSIR